MTDRPQTVRGLRPVVLDGGDVRSPARACAWFGIRAGWGMDKRGLIGRCGFRAPAFLWLPAGLVAFAVLRFRPDPAAWESMLLLWARSPVAVAPCGLPLALGCRRLWRLGYRSTAWTAGVVLGVVTVAASLVAGLLGPIAIAAWALVISLPAWIAGWWLARRA